VQVNIPRRHLSPNADKIAISGSFCRTRLAEKPFIGSGAFRRAQSKTPSRFGWAFHFMGA
jgi:hypothetical protein